MKIDMSTTNTLVPVELPLSEASPEHRLELVKEKPAEQVSHLLDDRQ